MIGLLVQHGARVNNHGFLHFTALHFACACGRNLSIDELIKYRADVKTRTLGPKNVRAIMIAAEFRHNDCVKALVETHGASLNAVSTSNDTALHHAAGGGSVDIIRTLLTYQNWDVNKGG